VRSGPAHEGRVSGAKSKPRAVLITGGTGGLGTAVTNRFVADGHSVVVTSRPGESTVAGAPSGSEQFHLLHSDVTDAVSVAELVSQTAARLGTIEVLVHLVGGWAGGHLLQDTSPETWERVFAVNLRSAFLCCRAVLPLMRQQGWGRIVLISAAAARSGRTHQGAYAVAKAGLSVLAETIAEENDDLDVTANVVGPSALDTPANRAALADSDRSSLVPVDDVATMIAFLASAEAGHLRAAWLPASGRA
jgi:NAD(P)-dependent dehydrogenase (short-subunit alcohol dehydrogenase family)